MIVQTRPANLLFRHRLALPALFAWIWLAACAATHSSRADTAAAQYRLAIFEQGGARTVVKAEVVSTPEARETGLMYRQQLTAQSGMLFVFDETSDHTFWMKNTYIALDMIFISEDGHVVGVVRDAEPLTTTSHSVSAPSRYVLEVNAGFAQRNGIDVGTPVRFEP